MLKSKSKILFFILTIAILLSSVCFATDGIVTTSDDSANPVQINEDDSNKGETTASESDITNNDLYLSGDDIVIEGLVDGNVFAIGKNVTVKGEVGGDVFVLAETITVESGYIYSSLFALANNIKIDAMVYDVYAMCNNLTIDGNGYIYRDLKATGNKITINGIVRRNAYISAKEINFSELSETYIGGKLVYSAPDELSIPEGAVAGEVTFNKAKEKESSNDSIGSYILQLVMTVIATVVISLLAIWLTPNFVKKVSNMGIKKTLIALPIGLGGVIGILIASIILIVTVIGLQLGFALLAVYFLLIAFCTAFSSMVIAGLIAKKSNLEGKMKFILLAIAATVVIWALSLIPFVGGLVGFLNLILGFGTVIFNLFTKIPEETKISTEN